MSFSKAVEMGDLARFRLSPDDALFVDFDGTLAELGPDPDAIRLEPGTARALEALAARLGGALAVISGRDLRDLAARAPGAAWLLGGHGLETLSPGAAPEPAPPGPSEAVLAPLRLAARRAGVRLELKGPVAALHYRAAPEAEAACRAAADEAARAAPGLVTQAGKMVVEVKPEAAHKGRALRAMMARPPFLARRPVMIGDDATDEDAIAAAVGLGGIGVKIGAGASAAPLRAPGPSALRAWLAREANL